jgi:hypothetical protein
VTVKRSGREGRWADIPSARVRFALEAAFLLVVAAGAALTRLSPQGIIALLLVALLLVALVEWASSRKAAARPDEAPQGPALPAPAAPLEERPSRAQVNGLEPDAPVAELEIEVTEVVITPPAPAVTKRPLELPGLEQPEQNPVDVPAPVGEALPPSPPPPEQAPDAAAPARQPPPAPQPAPQQWNLWDLERRAREQAGEAARDEEWIALFVHLRQFANAKGVLPMEFDDLVRDSFAELIRAA